MTASDVTTDTDRAEFEARYREHHGMVYSRLLARTRDAHQAKDLTATAFMKAWEHRDSFHGGNYPAWVWTIASNAHLDHVKSSAVQREIPVFPVSSPSDGERDESLTLSQLGRHAAAKDPAEVVADRDEVAHLLGSLTEQQRELLTYRYLLDDSRADVATHMGWVTGAHTSKRTTAAVTAARSVLQDGREPVAARPAPAARPASAALGEGELWTAQRIAREYGHSVRSAQRFIAQEGVEQVATSVDRYHAHLYDARAVHAAYQARENSGGNAPRQKVEPMADQNGQQDALPQRIVDRAVSEAAVLSEWELSTGEHEREAYTDQLEADHFRNEQLNQWHGDDEAAEVAADADVAS